MYATTPLGLDSARGGDPITKFGSWPSVSLRVLCEISKYSAILVPTHDVLTIPSTLLCLSHDLD